MAGRPEASPETPLGERLRAVRRALGDPDRTAFAETLGIHKNTIAFYERGARVPDAATISAYRERYRVNLNWLATGEGEMFEGPSRVPQAEPVGAPVSEWLFNELGKIVVREHKAGGERLLPEMVAPEAVKLYNELIGMVRDVTDHRTVEAVLPLLAENLRERLRKAAAEPGTGKREAS